MLLHQHNIVLLIQQYKEVTQLIQQKPSSSNMITQSSQNMYENVEEAIQKCIGLADDLLQVGYYKQCLDLYNDLIEMFPQNSILKAKKGLVYLKKEELSDAIKCFGVAIKNQSDKITIINYKLLKADAFYAFHHYQKALTIYTQILRKMPNTESVLYRKGLCLMSLNKHSSAIKFFDKTLKKDYHYAQAHFMKANCLFVLGQYKKAVSHFINAVLYGEFATNIDLLMTKGFCHYHLQQFDKAKICFQNGLDIDPSYKEIKFYLTLIKIKEQQKQCAKSEDSGEY